MFTVTPRGARAPPLARSLSQYARTHIPVIRTLGQMRRWRAQARSLGLEVGLIPTVRPSLSALTPDGRAARRAP
jgi:hypothetical protein